MNYIKEKFREVKDKRHQGYIGHKLEDVLIIIMCATLCGLDGLEEIVVFANKRTKLLSDKFGIEAIPSKPTFCRILNMMDGDEVSKVIIEIMKERTKFIKHISNIIAVDGKAIRSTIEKGKPNSALQIITAYLTGCGVVLGQKSIHEKTNEIPVFQEMLKCLNIEGKTITADAMHCQRETCRQIIKKGGDYVFGLKGNQKNLHENVSRIFNNPLLSEHAEEFKTCEKNAGRKEIRICRKISNIEELKGKKSWSGLKTIFEITRITISKHKNTKEVSYYISSLDCSAEELLNITREHWKIESMHWLLDVVFSEDECKLISENGHKTLNSFRKLALLIHKESIASLAKKISIKRSLLSCLLDDETLGEILENL